MCLDMFLVRTIKIWFNLKLTLQEKFTAKSTIQLYYTAKSTRERTVKMFTKQFGQL